MTNDYQSSIKVAAVGNALSAFLVITYLLCVGLGLLLPSSFRMYEVWVLLLPGFEWLTWLGFFSGLVCAYVYGWYIAVIFVPLYHVFSRLA